jgi:hypothetical protein
MTFGKCFKCSNDDVFINSNGLCNWCDATNYFMERGITTQKEMEDWLKRQPQQEIIDCPCCRNKKDKEID